jgi:hypothetical protein
MNPQRKRACTLAGPSQFNKMEWLRGSDLNRRPPGYEPDELPGCSTPRKHDSGRVRKRQTNPEHRWQRIGCFTLTRAAAGKQKGENYQEL